MGTYQSLAREGWKVGVFLLVTEPPRPVMVTDMVRESGVGIGVTLNLSYREIWCSGLLRFLHLYVMLVRISQYGEGRIHIDSLPVRRTSSFQVERLRKMLMYGKEFGKSRCRKGSEYLFGLSFMIVCLQIWSVIDVILQPQICVGCVVRSRRIWTT
ncbi:hypothetical protein V6N13_007685 [Hibiscus sabdariffa]